MIRAHFGIEKQAFAPDDMKLLPHQQEVFETLRVHCQQGGLCLIVGEPGTGKSIIKHALCRHDPKRLITPVVNRTPVNSHLVVVEGAEIWPGRKRPLAPRAMSQFGPS